MEILGTRYARAAVSRHTSLTPNRTDRFVVTGHKDVRNSGLGRLRVIIVNEVPVSHRIFDTPRRAGVSVDVSA